MTLVKLGETTEINGVASAALSDGTLVHVSKDPSGIGSGLFLQRVSADGEILQDPIDVGLDGLPGNVFDIDVAASPDGGFFVLVHLSTGSPTGLIQDEVYLRKFDADGSPVGAFEPVNKSSEGVQNHGSLAVGPDGQAAVAFTDGSAADQVYDPLFVASGLTSNIAPRSTDVRARDFDADGNPQGGPQILHADNVVAASGQPVEGRAGEQIAGQVAFLGDGTVVVPYIDTTFFVRDGGRVVSEHTVSVSVGDELFPVWRPDEYAVGGDPFVWTSQLPQAVALKDGGFAVTFLLRVNTGTFREQTFGQIMNADGSARTEPFLIIDQGQNQARQIDVTDLPNGGFAVLYDVANGADRRDLLLVEVTKKGSVKEPVVVADGAGDQLVGSITTAPDGSVYVAYSDNGVEMLDRFVLDANKTVTTGSQGKDSFTGAAGADWIDAEAGNDKVVLGDGNDQAWGGQGRDTLKGGEGKDALDGGNGADTLLGGKGNDTLMGGDKADHIDGGKGKDVLTGGLGSDVFEFRPGQAAGDTITDFDADKDTLRIDLDGSQKSSVKVKINGEDTRIVLKDDGNAKITLEDVNLLRSEINFDFI